MTKFMLLYVLIGQRIEQYPGQYGFEALACMTEYDMDANPEYMPEQLGKYTNTNEFSALKIVKLSVEEKQIRKILIPQEQVVEATVRE